jgi:hypothetical protein
MKHKIYQLLLHQITSSEYDQVFNHFPIEFIVQEYSKRRKALLKLYGTYSPVKEIGIYFCPRRRHTASITNLTRCGGLLNSRNSVISFLFKQPSAFIAASIAGTAALRSLWASSAKTCVSAAFAYKQKTKLTKTVYYLRFKK